MIKRVGLLWCLCLTLTAHAGVNYDGPTPGGDDTVTCTTIAALNDLGSMSIFVRMRFGSTGNDNGRFVAKEGGTDQWLLYGDTGGFEYSYALNTTSAANFCNANFSAGTDYTFIVVYDGTANGSGVDLFKNGTECTYIGTGNALSTSVHDDSGGNVTIGNTNTSDRTVDADIYEVCIWNDNLTSAERSQLDNASAMTHCTTVSVNSLVFSTDMPCSDGTTCATAWTDRTNGVVCTPSNSPVGIGARVGGYP